MLRPWQAFGIVAAIAVGTTHADLPLIDHNADGVRNVLDLAIERGLTSSTDPGADVRAPTGSVAITPMDSAVSAGDEVRLLFVIDSAGIPFFGYSLDIDIAPVGPTTGSLVPNVSLTNFFDAQNLITAGGATRDPLFSVIQGAADGGVFASTNTSDASAILPVTGVNDVLIELVLDAGANASGEFRVEFGPGTAFAGANGQPVPLALSSASVVVASAQSTGDTHYETGDCLDSNDVFSARETVNISDPYCSYISGMLQENQYPGRYPDTYLFMFDKDDNIVCEDNDSSAKGNGKASACYDVAPIDSGGGEATIRLGITGRPDGVDNKFNGLFFNTPHGQLGEAEVCITYYGDDGPRGTVGTVLGTDTYLCTFVTGAEAFRVNFVVPTGTVSVDVEIDNTTESFPICNDVDFYELDGLEAACDYAITVIGGTEHDGEYPCAILGWYDKNGGLVSIGSEPFTRNGGGGQGAQLSVISDANGRVRLAVSGVADEDFDGWREASDPRPNPRTVETPGYTPPPAHGCCTCYTIKVEWNKHIDGEPTLPCNDDLTLQMANGDLNLDGGVDVIDLGILLNNWGGSAP